MGETDQAWYLAMRSGQELFQHGHLNAAIEAFDTATRLRPDRAAGWANLGICLGDAGRNAAALRLLDQALRLDARLVYCHLARGKNLQALNRGDEARCALEDALRLERIPEALNELGNLLRTLNRPAEAIPLYREAMATALGNTLYMVNEATCLAEKGDYALACTRLKSLLSERLPPEQHQEAADTLKAIMEHDRLDSVLDRAAACANPDALVDVLGLTAQDMLLSDEQVMRQLHAYAESARRLPADALHRLHSPLPDAWPEIEALLMVPVIETPDEYKAHAGAGAPPPTPAGEWLESMNMIRVIESMRLHPIDSHHPIRAEGLLRLWHMIACSGLKGFLPGHFKVTRNKVGNHAITRARPSRVAGSIRQLIGELCTSVPPGTPRALLLFMGLLDLHPFSDGNGRVAMALMNRELEALGYVVPLFPRTLGFKGELAAALARVRGEAGDLGHLVPALRAGQEFALRFIDEIQR